MGGPGEQATSKAESSIGPPNARNNRLSGTLWSIARVGRPLADTLVDALQAETASLAIPLLDRDPRLCTRALRPQVSFASEIPVGFVDPQPDACAYQALSARYLRGAVQARLLAPEHHVRCLVQATLALARRLQG